MKHGFIKLAAAVPEISVAAPEKNEQEILRCIQEAAEKGVHVLCFPELSLTGCTCGDLFLTDALLDSAEKALFRLVEASTAWDILVFVGVPLRRSDKLYNCAVGFSGGKIWGIVPKVCLSAADRRYFAPGEDGRIFLDGKDYCFGDYLFTCTNQPALSVGCMIGTEWESADSRLRRITASGATVAVCLGGSPEIVGKEGYRRSLAAAQSGMHTCAIVYSGAGEGESTTDYVFSGHSLIASGGVIITEKRPFTEEKLLCGVVDICHLCHDRRKNAGAENERSAIAVPGVVTFPFPYGETDLTGVLAKRPFIPEKAEDMRDVCSRILEIQARGLAKRLRASHAKGAVVALSGGLDSTLALIVTVRAMDILARGHEEILSVTMPCFGTTNRTRSNAEELAAELGTSFRCIDIKEAVDLHFRDIGHDAEDHSVVYENAQARERTQIIMDIANRDGSLVIGTGDLSELALGWATYNGDHMSNYGVNGGVPKTLIRYVVSYYADICEEGGKTRLAQVLRDILDTPVSPELLPPKDGDIAQRTEDIVGPYDLHDFFLYHLVRWGETPEKIYREAKAAFAGEFADDVIEKWLRTFLRRFYTQQFKRSALPDGPKVGSVGFSPRGDWQMPSDAVPEDVHLG
ncbi:MAG: NAD(+) synthase [Clostridia bacterium]|nr:NAD(+) synthase [Clostridia bacterium]